MTDTPQLLLTHHLTALKLPSFLREYDKLAPQCAVEGVDYPRYLLRLAELELIERERRKWRGREIRATFASRWAYASPDQQQQYQGCYHGQRHKAEVIVIGDDFSLIRDHLVQTHR